MDSRFFSFVWRHSKREQFFILALTVSSFPLVYISLEIPKIIINDLRCADQIMALADEDNLRLSEQERTRYYAWRGYMVRQAMRVVDRLFELSGGNALYLKQPLQRIWRDVHATNHHLGLHYEFAMEAYGRTLVGLPSGSLM